MWTKYILQKLTSANKTFTLKSSLSGQRTLYKETQMNQIYAGQNVYRKKKLIKTKYILKKVASVDKIYIIKTSLGG